MAYVYYKKSRGTASDFNIVGQEGWKQQTPFQKKNKLDQPYYRNDYTYISGNTNQLPGGMSMRAGGSYANEFSPTPDYIGSTVDNQYSFTANGMKAYARAYAKFKAKCYTQADTLTALIERGKTIDMVLHRVHQLYDGARALKRGDFRSFLFIFKIQPLKKHQNKIWSRPKEFGGLWLEYWMGWAPTVGDINNALESLLNVPQPIPIRAGSSVPIDVVTSTTASGSTFNNTWHGNCTVYIKAHLSVTNPNLFTYNGLGLLNPVGSAWKTTPFSWFADWFLNVGQCLEQYTDWMGLQLVGLNVSCKSELSGSWVVMNARGYYNWIPVPEPLFRNRKVVFFTRKTGGQLPFVNLVFRIPNQLSPSRGATLASLLVTMFTPAKARTK